MGWIFLVCAFVLNSAGGFLLKLAAAREGFLSVTFIAGITCFAINVLFYFAALRMLPLSVAAPIMVSMTLIIVATLSLIFLGETLTTVQYVGYACVILGVVLVSAFATA